MFTLTDVSFSVSGKTILHPTSLTFESAKVTTLLGHNGCGKSTLIKMLSRQQQPTTGAVTIHNTSIDDFSHRDFALKVAYLPQHPPLTDGVTVRELVAFGRFPWKGALGRYSQDDHAIIDQAIERVGLNDFATRYVSTLSGGERQRAWVAMLLAQRSECILLDEPTSALDVAHQYELLALIRELNQNLGLTVIMVLHDINMAARFSDHLIAMHTGHIQAQGSPEHMMKEDVLASIYGVPLSLFTHPETGMPISYVR
ncbi:ABC transporter ATP-binding protein [Photobacterium sanguinicancri]|uniref:ATP-binding cassette domain-containing protein n=1 Tax=Photobacterium sanguinicancri TaxID=875932 RepID=A0AAW7Y6A1_9GAMM|nr:ATP-binding cassette domain-containing protein [Photobacterium sanguinicancri]MDO6501017.1 ATP-binding cassette domain-containing protein [Photobacterium sanguinicancri]MDO6543987.1 ATP-binding cassette domain-containing protein [Photobacterium sanguinicancri]